MADNYLSAPKRNALLGLLSDTAGKINAFAQTPDPTMPMGKANPLLALLSEFAGVPAVQRTLDRLSYGEPITNAGKANVPLIPADTADAAMALAPIAGAAMKYGPGVVRTAARNAMTPATMTRASERGVIMAGEAPYWADEFGGIGGKLNADGTVTVYHRTSPEAADAILKTGVMRGAEDGLFFSSHPAGQAAGFGDAVIEMRVPASKLQLDDLFSDEAHFRLPTKRAGQPVFVNDWIKK